MQVYETAARLRARIGYYVSGQEVGGASGYFALQGITQVLGSYSNTAHTSIKIVPVSYKTP